ncbi:hypothetical protein [Acidomonas methanolica]|uniref:Uncharacterized protein n=1 Tax=Acidomonas methanolica NBRC 104435 TaxID=1231351 RepID=A0A023D6P0_ACIMT|nr:hypothetical protein [Acidomonas methanolica]TCS23829.1 hypothetical protein EDC31_12747 [Acidomonas methanolica]GAJ29827.1 hypothetical protein Amme_083_002 [Acidomonas methanolica NBRC 104435]GBQ52929.1 hypothetical protein AA0498_1836 [Acidomonas methanolica]GEL00176.1 hypothetical protein AME01nite_26740 [Acidomonas methanolica NBRC 104435]
MKIEIDLNDILGDEYGAETLQESVKRQVIEHLSSSVEKDIKKRISEETNRILQEELQSAVKEKMPALIDDLLTAEYVPTDRYGRTEKATTLCSELIRVVSENMVYKKGSYRSENNAFTNAVDAVIEAQVDGFKKEFVAKVDASFKAEALRVATQSILAKLGVPQSA